MDINIEESSIMAIRQLVPQSQEEISDIIYAVDAAKLLNDIKTVYPEAELVGSQLTILVRVNEQHVTACVRITQNQNGEADVTVISYS